MIMAFKYGILLLLFWLLLSGHFEPLLLGLGLASVALTVFLMKRMNVIDHESYPLHLSTRLFAFIVYIIRDIVVANIDVIKRIMTTSGKAISPRLVEIPLPQKNRSGACYLCQCHYFDAGYGECRDKGKQDHCSCADEGSG